MPHRLLRLTQRSSAAIGSSAPDDRMLTVRTTRTIHAPLELVFHTLATPEEFSRAVPGIVDIEFLTEQTSGVGTRFRETREIRGRRSSTVLEVTEYERDDHIRLVADQGGTVWDTVFSVRPQGDAVEMTMVMECRPYRLLARLMNVLIIRVIRRLIDSDMDALKTWCEQQADRTCPGDAGDQ